MAQAHGRVLLEQQRSDLVGRAQRAQLGDRRRVAQRAGETPQDRQVQPVVLEAEQEEQVRRAVVGPPEHDALPRPADDDERPRDLALVLGAGMEERDTALHRRRGQRLALDHRADEPRLVGQPAVGVGARGELLDHADRRARPQVRDDRLIRQEVVERELHSVRDVGEVLVVADQLLLDPLVDRRAPESPLPVDLQRGNLALHHELGDRRLVEVKVGRQLVHGQQLRVGAAIFGHKPRRNRWRGF